MTKEAIETSHQKWAIFEARLRLMLEDYKHMDDNTKKKLTLFIMAHSLDLKKELDKLYQF